MNDLQKIRNEYSQKLLSESDVADNPLVQFNLWFDEVLKSEIHEPTACTLSTANKQGKPSGRIILLKGVDEKGFSFFTNYESRKGMELAENPFGAITFFWKELERQIRIEGAISKVSNEENDAYYNSRPKGSRIGAWVSPQSTVIENRSILEEGVEHYTAKFPDDVPRPEHWGGYMLNPEMVEFWQGRPNRLHDRIRYSRSDDSWKIERLAP